MINWLVEQSLLLTLILSLLLLGGRWLTKVLGANGHYGLWLIVPLSLIVNTIDFSFWMEKNPVTSFLVSAKVQANELSQVELDSNVFFITLWLIGLITIVGYYAVLHIRTVTLSNKHLVPKIGQTVLSDELIDAKVKIGFTSDSASPYILGVFSPSLIIPVSFQQLFTPEQQKLVLKHELIHFKRKDMLWNYLGMALTIIFWFNPLSWWSYRQFRILQELSCDQVALKGSNKQVRLQYAKALLSASSRHSIFNLSQLTFGEKSMLKERLNQLKINKPSSLISKFVVAITLLLSGAALTLANADISKNLDEVKPIVRINPMYPLEAAEKGIEGFVRMAFNINQRGKVDNIEVLKSVPEGVFDREAVRALAKWKYANLKGETVSTEVQLDFRISEDSVERIEIIAN